MTYKDILVELPLIVHNSHLLTSFLHQMPAVPSAELEFPTSLSDIKGLNPELPLYPAYETTLDMSIDPFLEKSCDLLLDAVESHYTELNNFQYVTNSPHLTILLTTCSDTTKDNLPVSKPRSLLGKQRGRPRTPEELPLARRRSRKTTGRPFSSSQPSHLASSRCS